VPRRSLVRPRRGTALVVLLTFVSLAPVIVVVVTRAGRDYLPVDDLAVIDLRVRDVFTRLTPLVGPFSKDFSHPGPLFFWALAVPSWLAGKAAWATLVGSALLMGVAIAASARVAWRVGGLTAFLVAMGALMLGLENGALFFQPWNPYAAIPFFTLYVLLAWSVLLHRWWNIVWLAVVGTFLVQTHVGYLVIVVGLLVVVAGVVGRECLRTTELVRQLVRPCIAGLVMLIILWTPPIIQQVTEPSGNLSATADYVRDTSDASIGMSQGLGLFAAGFRWRPPWLGGSEAQTFLHEVLPVSLWWLVIPVVLLGAAWLAQRHPPRTPWGAGPVDPERPLLIVVSSTTVLGAIALAQIRPRVDAYLMLWRWPLAALLVVTSVLVVIRRLTIGRWLLRGGGVLMAALIVMHSIQLAVDVASAPRNRVAATEPMARAILDQLSADEIPDNAFFIESANSPVPGVFDAIVDDLDRHGAPVRLAASGRFKWGDRVTTLDEVDTAWFVSTSGALNGQIAQMDSATVIAETSPLPAQLETELAHLQAEVWDRLDGANPRSAARVREVLDSSFPEFTVADEGIDLGPEFRAQVARIAALNTRVKHSGGCRCSVIAVSPEDASQWRKGRASAPEPG